jgi:hypothetical protein
MGDWFQSIVDLEATEDEAEILARDIIDWLVSEKIIDEESCDCVLGENSYGYPPGINWPAIVKEYFSSFLELLTNGLNISIGRKVFHSGQGPVSIACPNCNMEGARDRDWGDAISEWYTRSGEGIVTCTSCGRATSITKWDFQPVWGFAELGFEFWNWPPLKQSFIDELSHRLGHNILFIDGKL